MYSIEVRPDDILVFSYLGLRTVEIGIDNNTSELNIELFPKVEELDEVTVKKKRPFTQKELLIAYPTNMSLIKTSKGILDKDLVSFSIRIIDGKNLIPVGRDFLVSLQNLYPQMTVMRDKNLEPIYINPKVYLQFWSTKPRHAIFDVDGVIYEQPPTFIPVNDIDRVAILLRNGAISRYGPQGVGGVIIINTKSKAWMDDISIKRTYDNSGLRDSLIQAINKNDKYELGFPDYLKQFDAAPSVGKALEIFDDLKIKYGDSPYYFIEISDFFKRRWKNKERAGELLDLMGNEFPRDVAALKASAYKYEELGQFEKALEAYLKVLTGRSRAAQSHHDVANAYAEIGNYQRALNAYARYELAVNELDTIAFDSYGTDLLMTTESGNIIKLKGKELSLDKNTIDDALDNPSTRLLFEWNHTDAEFELQIVTPEGNNDGWENITKPDNALLQKEKLKGYSSKQFFLDDGLIGEWKINLNYKGNHSEVPTYLKVTTFFDYGKPTQRKKLKVFKLSIANKNVQLLTINTELSDVSK